MIIRDIERLSEFNTNFREVIHTGKDIQIALMSLPAGTNMGVHKYDDSEQVIFVTEGKGEVMINSVFEYIEDDDVILVEAGEEYDIRNAYDEDLKLYVVYSKPVYPESTVHPTRKDALTVENV